MRAREFVTENQISSKYLSVVNDLLKTNQPLQIQTKTKKLPGILDFIPDPDQQVLDLSSIITGTVQGQPVTLPARHIYKSPKIKSLFTGREIRVNKGEVAEGFHSVAAFARLVKRPSEPITLDDVLNFIDQLENNKTLIITRNETTSDIADEFHLTINLKPGTFAGLKDRNTIPLMQKILDSIIHDANQETSRFADRFATNQRFDRVKVIGDGVSSERAKKTDVRFENEAEQKFADFSIKVSHPQLHQVGGGAVEASKQERFDKVQNVFNVNGQFLLADISSIKDQFLRTKSNERAQELAYIQAAKSLNLNLMNDNEEKSFLKNLIAAIKFWATRNDPNVKLKEFTTSGTMILDINKVDQLLSQNQLNLVAHYDPSSQYPKIVIVDVTSGKELVTFRTYRTSVGYIRNYIEKGPLLTDLTLSKFIPTPTQNLVKAQSNLPSTTVNQSKQNTSINTPNQTY